MASTDAVVVGAGPNGLTAAVTLARAGISVDVYEAAAHVGGGARTEALTLPGYLHDTCSAVHPLAAGSPVFADMPLHRFGLRWLHPDLPLAHPTEAGVSVLTGDIHSTAAALGRDGAAYRGLLAPFVGHWHELAGDVLRAPVAAPPSHPVLLARFAARAGLPVAALRYAFRGERARALLAGLAAHAVAPVTGIATGGVALLFALAAHANGWPVPRGGSQAISDALAAYLAELGGRVHTETRVRSLAELPRARAYLLDTSPATMLAIAGERLSARYRRSIARYRYGPGVFKLDYALDGPVPWRDAACRRAGTVHLGASFREIAATLTAPRAGRVPDPPFLITTQPCVTDPTRAPEGKHVFWVYAHVPHGWDGDLTAAIEARLEHAAPGFTDLVLARAVRGPRELAEANPNYVGGDIACGSFSGRQALFRPTVSPVPYATPDPTLFLCSAATPPGPGVHGMCGFHAARVALRRVLR